ncbi:MAG: T9SS type A sorting domain-containing protein, partial [Bacteroidia bacterium]|nr:T9SS type A sorting domain-containing protein [Bacteroidia bacterium]
NHGLPFDTVANFVTAEVGPTKVNVVRLLGYYDPSQYVENTTIPPNNGTRIYNHGIVAEPTQRYKLVSGVDYFYPAFYSTVNLFPFIEFLVSSPNISVNSLSSATIKNIYPNPSNGGDVVVEMSSDVTTTALVTITDVTGKVVKTISADLVNGSNELVLNVDGLAKGMYVVSVKAEGVNSVSKLTIE